MTLGTLTGSMHQSSTALLSCTCEDGLNDALRNLHSCTCASGNLTTSYQLRLIDRCRTLHLRSTVAGIHTVDRDWDLRQSCGLPLLE